ncbi:MAG: ABC transporter ATP-binding protein [Brevinema sp.]
MSVIEIKNLTLSYGENVILKDLNLSIPKGKITIMIGANGCGKSTLLRATARMMKADKGTILVKGHDITKTSSKLLAKEMAFLPQSCPTLEGMTVFQLAKQGRYPHQSLFQQWTPEDEKIVNNALRYTGMSELSDRFLNELSGGQRQRAWISMILAQDTDVILLDEPTTYLDITHQIEVLDLLFMLNQRRGTSIVIVLHDLNLAARYADYLVAIGNQGVMFEGSPEEVMTTDNIAQVFDIENTVITCPIFKTPMCVPHSHICKYGDFIFQQENK